MSSCQRFHVQLRPVTSSPRVIRPVTRNKTLLGARTLTTRSQKLLGASGLTTRSKDATRSIHVPHMTWHFGGLEGLPQLPSGIVGHQKRTNSGTSRPTGGTAVGGRGRHGMMTRWKSTAVTTGGKVLLCCGVYWFVQRDPHLCG